ncbi:response regulator [Abyssalbus ytuae]|uniref:dolichyl-phosphate beta-glucosyltransferase n=1 Tax=Abyssalbus ytuae TaxID=2926907 RepID=A0A9E7D170_9FLAO|nr:response regulator [Abyssalbus ytuae]UOB19060.1 response regulator [Abyssalbus ytuae]
MKILAIDDQQLILLSLEKKLNDLGYEVLTCDNGYNAIKLFDSFDPDLIIVDINMPQMSGLELIKYIRIKKNSQKPIMVMSGNNDENIIVEGYELGINDYMKKPVSLNEVAARIKRLTGENPFPKPKVNQSNKANGIIREKCIGVVIPCYNEATRLASKEFTDFVDSNLGYYLCFINDGSTDNTLNVLNNLAKGRENYISVYNCEKNRGKAEAVRQGILFLSKNDQLDYIGYLDADLSTDFRDFDDLVKIIETSEFKIVSGSRISRMGANITKESARKIISMTINFIIQKILGMNFRDTQCGAKIMDKDIAQNMFNKPFITRWLFDVEIFMRMKKFYGKENALKMICEQPLKRWIHANGSKLSIRDSLKIGNQLIRIAFHYK